jgi:hypothetical protein
MTIIIIIINILVGNKQYIQDWIANIDYEQDSRVTYNNNNNNNNNNNSNNNNNNIL